MNITFPSIRPNILRLAPDDLSYYIQRYSSASDAWLSHRLRCITNQKTYASLGYDQWSKALLTELRREGRDPNTYNFSQYIIDGVVGNYMMNWFDPKFNDREGDNVDVSDATVALQKKYYSDKKQFDFKVSSLQSARNGCLFAGWEELVIKKDEDSRDCVGFNSLNPGLLIPDLHNMTDQISQNAKELFKEHFLTDGEMLTHFPHAKSEVIQALKINALRRDTPFEEPRIDMFSGSPTRFGQKRLVVEWYHIEHEKKAKVVDRNTLEEYPDFGFPFGSKEDFYAKAMYAREKNRQFDPNDLIVIQKSSPVLWCTTFCPELVLLLDNRKDRRQLDGRLPFYNWSFIMLNGINIGLMDLIKDAQDDINKREASKTKVLTETPIGGKMFLHPDAFGGPGQELNDAIRDATDSTKPYVFHPDVPPQLAQSLVGIMNGMQISPDILRDESVKIEFMSKIGRLPPAMQGFTEKSGESGIMLGRKIIEGSVMQRVPMEFMMSKERQKARDWLKMTLKLKGSDDPHRFMANLNQRFKAPDESVVTLNEVMTVDDMGNPIEVKNDVRKLRSVEVDITETKENDFVRQMKRESTVAARQAMQPNQINIPIIAELDAQIVTSMDYATTKDREQAEAAAELTRKLAKMQAEVTMFGFQQQLNPPPPSIPEMPGGEQTGQSLPPDAVLPETRPPVAEMERVV